MSSTGLSDADRAVWDALCAWLMLDERGRAVLASTSADPDSAARELNRWIHERSAQAPPPVATYISGGQVDKVITIAQAGAVHIQQTPITDPSEREQAIMGALLTFLEDRRLLTGEAGYHSHHHPDHLRHSAQQIRQRTNQALQDLGRGSRTAPALKRLQAAARNFQEEIEGAMDGARAIGGGSPYKLTALDDHLRSLESYRREMLDAIVEAASQCEIEFDRSLKIL